MNYGSAKTDLGEIISHYDEVDEDSRLQTGYFRLEFARTQELISRHLPPAPARILDIGGGSGVYAGWLALLGYEVHLTDPVPKHIEQARARSTRLSREIASARVGDARHIEEKDGAADVVLLLGPLYHLTERSERLLCLREAFRVLRMGGWLFAAAISRFASLMDSLRHGFFDDPEFAPILERDVAEGQHRNPTGNPMYFSTAFFHRPAELGAEIREAGFQLQKVVAIEGPGWMAQDFDSLWADERRRTRLLDYVRRVEQEPELMGVSAHLLGIAKKYASGYKS
jgi:ubiquinone/menaquinone biosynthesis C-methylase UbiE